MKNDKISRFLKDSDDTGNFIVTSSVTNKKYFVEPIGNVRTDWGSYNPSTGVVENKKGWQKNRGSIDLEDSVLTKENGFENIVMLSAGESPMSYIDRIDREYEMKMNK